MNDIVWLTMRRLRTPLIVMILVYSLSVFIMVQIPGRDPNGNTITVSYLDAVYFVSVMATTIGFGEIPYPFTHVQRLFAFILVFPNVIAWLYSVGTIISLFVDPQFRAVLSRTRFSRRVRRMSEGFYIVCGLGHTGRMIVRGLLSRGIGAAMLEREQDIVLSITLDAQFAHLPALSGDVTDRRLLDIAGLSPEIENCIGVIAITNEDHANLTVSITSKLLRPELPVLARAETRRTVDNMASFGTDHIVDPYAIFAQRFFLALSSPTKYLVQDWLIGVPGSRLRTELNPPAGRWILAGVGRFGTCMAVELDKAETPYTVIDVHPDRVLDRPGSVLGRGTEASTLEEAGVRDAVGIIAGTGDDMDNLSIVMTARELNPSLFVVARQENPQNDELFDASGADLVARRSLIVARRVLALATTPLLMVFIDYLVHGEEVFANTLKHRLSSVLDGRSPSLWTVTLTGKWAESIRAAKKDNVTVRVEHLTQNARMPGNLPLDCVCLLLQRGSSRIFLPGAEQAVIEGDTLLFAGRGGARHEMLFALTEPTTLVGLASGRPQPRGTVMRALARKRGG